MRLVALLSALLMLVSAAGYHAYGQSRIVGPSDSVLVSISDWDLNANPRGIDRYENQEFVVFRTSREEVGEAHPELVETGANTGLFEFTIQLETDERACRLDLLAEPGFAAVGGSDPRVGVCPGDVLLVQYEDNRGADGRSALVDYVFEVESWDPEFTADQISYLPGDRIAVDIYDPDANRDPDVADNLRDVRVFSESDPAGRQFSAIETGRNTGLFKVSFSTSSQPQGNAIFVKDSDEITVQYIDDFPADFVALQEEKRFNFVIVMEHFDDFGSLEVAPPTLRTMNSNSSGEISVGQQAVLSAVITNPFDSGDSRFVAITEVRTVDGITVDIGWQSGYVRSLESAEVGTSWLPQNAGNYQIRVFLISDLLNPQVLSIVTSSEVTVT
jgi:hypothetical protein